MITKREFNAQINPTEFYKQFDKYIENAKSLYGLYAHQLSINTDINKSIFELHIAHCDNLLNKQEIEQYLLSGIQQIVTSQIQ